MGVAQALRLCPHAIVVTPHFERYASLSRQVMAIFHDITPLVEPLSIDEAFLDVSGARRLWGSPGEIARMLRTRVKAETGLSAASASRPPSMSRRSPRRVRSPTASSSSASPTPPPSSPRCPSRRCGGGAEGRGGAGGRGIRLVSDILASPRAVLDRALGPAGGERIWQLAHGIDPRTVETQRTEKSIGHEETFLTDVADAAVLRSELRRLSDRVAARLRAAAGVRAPSR
jgi:DNA polymerase-4